MANNATIVTEFVIECLPGVALARRLQITRALADMTPEATAEHRELRAMARDLERIEKRQRKLAIIIRRKRGGR